jgi:hypothetical protein
MEKVHTKRLSNPKLQRAIFIHFQNAISLEGVSQIVSNNFECNKEWYNFKLHSGSITPASKLMVYILAFRELISDESLYKQWYKRFLHW